MELVSVIITTYGEPKYLKNAILSVLNQTYQNIQLIVVDDNDNNTQNRLETEILVEELRRLKKFEYYKHDRNRNGAYARNTGIKYATGEYISFLDSDDAYFLNRIEVIISRLPSSGHMGAYSGCLFKYMRSEKAKRKAVSGNFLYKTLCTSFNFYTGSNLFIKKTIVDELKGFDVDFIRHQDYEFLARYFSKGYTLLGISEILVIKNNINLNLPNIDKMKIVKRLFLEKFRTEILRYSRIKQKVIRNEHLLQLLLMKNDSRKLFKYVLEFTQIILSTPIFGIKKTPRFVYKLMILIGGKNAI